MQSKRQPKVHTYSKKRRRKVQPARAILSVGFTFLVAGVIGVVGYSIAKPILEYSGAPRVTEQAEGTLPAATAAATAEISTEAETLPAVATSTPAVAEESLSEGYQLSAAALENSSTLSTAMQTARNAVPTGKLLVIPLKIAGGELCYQTDVALAKSCGAAKGSLQLSEIAEAAKAQGWTPVAQLSLLRDNLLPDADAEAGYMVTSGGRWLDNTKENGGKAWASPFSDVTVQYLKDITAEVTAAGFSQIWCTDVVFPDFQNSDLTYIGESVQNPERKTALTSLVNTLAQTAGSVPLWVETSAADAAAGTAEVFDPENLTVSGVVMDLQADAGQAQAILPQIQAKTAEMPLCLTAEISGAPAEELQTLKSAADNGVSAVVLTEK